MSAPESSATLVVAAPAKINLFLHVTGRVTAGPRRGYHQLESLMVLVDLADSLRLTRRDDGRIVREHAVEGVTEADDLALRAAALLKDRSGSRLGVSIALDKRIPIGAGLGGGSSDAASVLLGLNRLWGLHMARRDLMQIGVELGADVPFFVFGRNAHASGIGEILRAVSVPRAHLLIAAPDAGVSTAAIFGAAGLERSTPATGALAFPAGFGRNDLESVAIAHESSIAVVARALASVGPPATFGPALTSAPAPTFGLAGTSGPAATSGPAGTSGRAATSVSPTRYGKPRMTGSGSAVYRIVDAAVAASWASESRDPRGFRVFRSRFLESHPLREFVAK